MPSRKHEAQVKALTTELEQARQENLKRIAELHHEIKERFDAGLEINELRAELEQVKASMESRHRTMQELLNTVSAERTELKAERVTLQAQALELTRALQSNALTCTNLIEQRNTRAEERDAAVADLTALRDSSAALVEGIEKLPRYAIGPVEYQRDYGVTICDIKIEGHKDGDWLRMSELRALLPVSEGK